MIDAGIIQTAIFYFNESYVLVELISVDLPAERLYINKIIRIKANHHMIELESYKRCC